MEGKLSLFLYNLTLSFSDLQSQQLDLRFDLFGEVIYVLCPSWFVIIN